MAKMRPQKGKQPQAPKTPTKPVAGKAGRRVSKTNDPKCTQAMSMLQKAIKSGQRPTAEVNATLAMCRNRQRRKLDAPQRKERLKKIQELRRSGDRGKALEMARADRKGQTARNESAVLLRQLRQGRGGQYATRAQAKTTTTDRTQRGNELLERLREVTPSSTLRRAGRHARGDRSYEQRRQNRRTQATSAAPAPEPVRRPPTRAEEAEQRIRNSVTRAGNSGDGGVERITRADILKRLRQTRAGRAIAADVRQRMPNATTRDYRFAINEAQTQATSNIQRLRDQKVDAINDRVRRNVYPERDTINRIRRETAAELEVLRGARAANNVRGRWGPSATNENIQLIRAATPRNGSRSAPLSARAACANVRATAQQRAAMARTAARTPARRPAPAPAPAASPAPATPRTRAPRAPRGTAPTPLLQGTTSRPLQPVPQAQLDAARQQSGTFNDYGTFTHYDRSQQQDFVRRAESELNLRLHGNTTEEKFGHFLALSGIPPQGAGKLFVRIQSYGDTKVAKYNYSDQAGSTLKRSLYSDSVTGEIRIHNDLFLPQGRLLNDGHPMDVYSRSIIAAKSAGVHYIDVQGGGSGAYLRNNPTSMSGFHVWPSYGFDAKLSTAAKRVFSNAHPQLANVKNFSQALFHPDPVVAKAAKDAWKADGLTMINYQLDLTTPNSTSFNNFNTFWRGRRNQDFSTYNSQGNASRNGDFNAYN